MLLNICNWLLSIISGICGTAYLFINGGSYTAPDFLKCLGLGFLIFIIVWICVFLLIWIFFILIALTISFKKEYKSLSKFYSYIFTLWYKYVCAFAHARIHFSGLDLITQGIPKDKKFLAVCNHRSGFDNFIMTIALSKVGQNISYITKPENYKIPLARNYMKRGLYISIDRDNVRNALKSIMKSIEYINEGIVNIGVFPEGTRSKNGELLPFKPGCLKVAEKSECPIVVCTVQGSEKIIKNFFWKRTDVYFDVLKVIQPEEFVEISTVDVSDEIRKLMLEKLGK